MRIQRLVALLIAAVLAPIARAGDVQVSSSTQYLRYPDFLNDKDTDQQDVAEYLRLNATFGEKKNITVAGYGRIVGALVTSVEPRNELADDVTGRLYYLYLDYRDVLPGHLDLRAGRTFVGTNAIPGIVDGAQLTARDVGVKGFGVSAFGGRRVFLDNKSELPFDDDYMMGGGVTFDAVAQSHAELTYGREYRAAELAREELALDLTTTPVGAVSVFGRAKLDLIESRPNELSLGVKYAPIPGLVLRGEVYDTVPTFDRESFYRFFQVEHYRQYSAGAEYRVLPWLRLEGSYAFEKFDADESANVWSAGFRAKPIAGLFVNASYEGRDGYAGRLGGLRASAGYTISRATLMAGADYDDFKRQDSRDGTAKKYWGGVDVEITKHVGAAVRFERNENFLFDASYQGFAAVDVHL